MSRAHRWPTEIEPMLKIKKIDHVAICVADAAEAAKRWSELLGVEAGAPEFVASQGTDAVLMECGSSHLELVAPHGNAAMLRFLDKRGPGLHHIAIEVEGIEDAVAFLKTLGVAMVDEEPRAGARGSRVAFIHPKATGGVLVELVEPAASPAPGER